MRQQFFDLRPIAFLTSSLPILYVATVDSISHSQPARFSFDGKIFLLAAIIFLTALSVRLYKLGGQTLECDELYTIPAATGHQYVYLSHESGAGPGNMPITTADYKQLLMPEARFGLGAVTAVLKRNVHLPAYFYLTRGIACTIM